MRAPGARGGGRAKGKGGARAGGEGRRQSEGEKVADGTAVAVGAHGGGFAACDNHGRRLRVGADDSRYARRFAAAAARSGALVAGEK